MEAQQQNKKVQEGGASTQNSNRKSGRPRKPKNRFTPSLSDMPRSQVR